MTSSSRGSSRTACAPDSRRHGADGRRAIDLALSGKRALVTGATGGIGLGIAIALAGEGAIVAVNGRSSERLGAAVESIGANGGARAVPILADLTAPDGPDRAADAAVEALGGVDILVNNFGGMAYADQRDWLGVTPAEWATSYERNVIVPARLIGRLLPAMRAAGWGRIVNISSGGGAQPGSTIPDYVAAKAATNNMTKSLSRALAGSGVTANAVSPGVILTEAIRAWLDVIAAQNGWTGDAAEIERRYTSEQLGVAAGRMGRPGDIGRAVAFLASPHSDYITGINLEVDGGLIRTI